MRLKPRCWDPVRSFLNSLASVCLLHCGWLQGMFHDLSKVGGSGNFLNDHPSASSTLTPTGSVAYSSEGVNADPGSHLTLSHVKLNSAKAFTLCYFYKGDQTTLSAAASIFELIVRLFLIILGFRYFLNYSFRIRFLSSLGRVYLYLVRVLTSFRCELELVLYC